MDTQWDRNGTLNMIKSTLLLLITLHVLAETSLIFKIGAMAEVWSTLNSVGN